MKETKYKKELVEFDVEKAYKTEEVMEMLKKQPKRKFVESVDVAVKLGIDPKKSDQNVRGALTLPNSLGKKIIVVAFVEGDKAEEAKKAGADIIGSDDLMDKYNKTNDFRGEAYAKYQATTNRFCPWFPRTSSNSTSQANGNPK